ncbi:hypothetical protein [Azospirillum largimobile]
MRKWIGTNYMEPSFNGRNSFVGRIVAQDDGTWTWMIYQCGPIIIRHGVEPSEVAAKAAVEAGQNAFQGYGPRDMVVSVHEAAHAVLAYLTGFLVYTSHLVADTIAPGVETARHELLVDQCRRRQALSDADLDRMHAGVFAAGYVAETRFLSATGVDHDDYISVTGAYGDRLILTQSQMADWNNAKTEAERVLDGAGVWDGVMKVAGVLYQRTPPVIRLAELQHGAIQRITGL